MSDIDYAELQERYGGRYVARRDGEVIATEETYDQLVDRLTKLAEEGAFEWSEITIAYIHPATIIGIYSVPAASKTHAPRLGQ